MSAAIVNEIHADHGRICAFLLGQERLATAYRQVQGGWLLKTRQAHFHCQDFDSARIHVKEALPGNAAVFERRTIVARHHYHGRLEAFSRRGGSAADSLL